MLVQPEIWLWTEWNFQILLPHHLRALCSLKKSAAAWAMPAHRECYSRKMLANQEDTLWVLSMEGRRKWLHTHVYTNPITQELLWFPWNSVLLEKGWKLHNSWMSDSKLVSILFSLSSSESSHCIAPSNWCLCSQILFVLETCLLEHTYPLETLQPYNSATLLLWLIYLHSVLGPLVSTVPVTVCETANERWNCQENCLESLIKWGEKKKNKKIIMSLRNRKQAVLPNTVFAVKNRVRARWLLQTLQLLSGCPKSLHSLWRLPMLCVIFHCSSYKLSVPQQCCLHYFYVFPLHFPIMRTTEKQCVGAGCSDGSAADQCSHMSGGTSWHWDHHVVLEMSAAESVLSEGWLMQCSGRGESKKQMMREMV